MINSADRHDVNEDVYDESELTDQLRGILQVGRSTSINLLHANAIDALAVRLYEGDWHLANYDSSQVATQFMDAIFGGLIYDFWITFTRFHRLPYPDMLMRFKEGSRHDALGYWPVVELDESTGLPRDLTDMQIIAHTQQRELKDWRHRRYKMHKMLSKAVRGCVALGYERSHFNIKKYDALSVRATMHVTMSQILKCVFGAKGYSYFRGEMNHIPGHINIDPSSMLAAQAAKESLTETLILVQSYGFPMPPDHEAKYRGYLRHPDRRPDNEMKILPIEYLRREPTDNQRADAAQHEARSTGYAAAASATVRPPGHQGPYSQQWPQGYGKGNRWNRR